MKNAIFSKKELPVCKVSVIVPTYKSQYLSDCLGSILRQTYKNFEIIIVDDCSNDATVDIIKTYAKSNSNIRYIVNSINQGVGASRNNGIAIAQGEYIAFLDHDDLWEANKLELQMEFFKENPGVGAVYCYCKFLDNTTDINRYMSSDPIADLLLNGAVFCMPGSVVIDTEIVKQAGMFPEEREISEDLALWLEVAALTKFSCLPQKLYLRREHSRQLSSERTGLSDELAVGRFFSRHTVGYSLRKRTEQALLMSRAMHHRIHLRFLSSCHAFFLAWLKWPLGLDAVKSLLVNIFRWRAATHAAQKWVKQV